MRVDALDGLVIAARRSGRLDGHRLRFNRAVEQLFFHFKAGTVEAIPIVLRGHRVCDDGSGYDEYGPLKQPDANIDAVIHTHQDRAPKEVRLRPIPGPKDGIVPAGRHIPNYGITSVGCWVVRPGPRLSVELLDGVWGEQFNPEAFADALARGAGNAAVGLGVKCR